MKLYDLKENWSTISKKYVYGDPNLLDFAGMKRASTWLTAKPISKIGYNLSRNQFKHAMTIRYGLERPNAQITCQCGHPFNLCHCISCQSSCIPAIRHNAMLDNFADELTKICSSVCI
ncbi:hypothetical protein GJ496_000504 [Pomphorhynchus laevis]|nr:hypothetical protein GJ496_000504 [Pomphorhynchus laevis]